MSIQLTIDNPGIGEWELTSVTAVASTDPGSGNWQTNAGHTRIDISDTDRGGLDAKAAIASLTSGSQVYLRVSGEARMHTITSATQRTGYVEIAVSAFEDSTSFTRNVGDIHSTAVVPNPSATSPEGVDVLSSGILAAWTLQAVGDGSSTWGAPGAVTEHTLGGVSHAIDSLVNLNSKISGGNIDFDTGTRDPNAHSNHTASDITDFETAHDALPSDNPHTVTKAQVGLTNADDTSDAGKPVSTDQQTEIDKFIGASPGLGSWLNVGNAMEVPSAGEFSSDSANPGTATQLLVAYQAAEQGGSRTIRQAVAGNTLTIRAWQPGGAGFPHYVAFVIDSVVDPNDGTPITINVSQTDTFATPASWDTAIPYGFSFSSTGDTTGSIAAQATADLAVTQAEFDTHTHEGTDLTDTPAVGNKILQTVGDGTFALIDTPTGSGDVTADATLTEDFLVTGDTAAKGVKTTTVTATHVADNTAKVTNANHTGDVSGATALTIGANKVTLGMHAQVLTDTFLGRTTPTTGDVEVLSGTDATALLDIATTALKGLAPATVDTDSAKYLSADGTYTAPTGGAGDVTSSETGTTLDGELVVFDDTTGKLVRRSTTITEAVLDTMKAVTEDTTTNPHGVTHATILGGTLTTLKQKISGVLITEQANEINTLTTQASPAATDLLIIEEAIGGVKKAVEWQDLPSVDHIADTTTNPHGVSHGNILSGTLTELKQKVSGVLITEQANELSQLTTEASPAATDLLLLEQAIGGTKRAVEWQDLPSGTGGHDIQEEGGAALAPRTNLNFIGPDVTAADNVGNDATDVTVAVVEASVTAHEGAITHDNLGSIQADDHRVVGVGNTAGKAAYATTDYYYHDTEAGTYQRYTGAVWEDVGITVDDATLEITTDLHIKDGDGAGNGITLAKLADGTADKFIGYDGAGAPAELSAPATSNHDFGGTAHLSTGELEFRIVEADGVNGTRWADPPAGSGTWLEDTYTPTLGQVTFILTQTPTEPISLSLHANGIEAVETVDYTLSGLTLTWLNTDFSMETTDGVVIQYK